MQPDDPDTYYYDGYADVYGSADPFGRGSGIVHKNGGETWCNLQGKYFHLVADESALKGLGYEISICNLSLIGTKYGRSEEIPTQIDVLQGEKATIVVPHIKSELEIGTKLAINLRQSDV